MFHDHFFTYFLFTSPFENCNQATWCVETRKLNVLIFVQLGFSCDFYNSKYHWSPTFERLFVAS
jgi:hypothetical protein